MRTQFLTHWGRVTHICVSDLTSIGSDNGLSPDRRQAIIWTNAGILLIRPLGTNFNEMLIEILTFSLKKMRLKVSSAKRQPFCLGLNELNSASHIYVAGFSTNKQQPHKYRKISNIRRTESPNLDVSRLVVELSSPNPMKPGIKSRMKM